MSRIRNRTSSSDLEPRSSPSVQSPSVVTNLPSVDNNQPQQHHGLLRRTFSKEYQNSPLTPSAPIYHSGELRFSDPTIPPPSDPSLQLSGLTLSTNQSTSFTSSSSQEYNLHSSFPNIRGLSDSLESTDSGSSHGSPLPPALHDHEIPPPYYEAEPSLPEPTFNKPVLSTSTEDLFAPHSVDCEHPASISEEFYQPEPVSHDSQQAPEPSQGFIPEQTEAEAEVESATGPGLNQSGESGPTSKHRVDGWCSWCTKYGPQNLIKRQFPRSEYSVCLLNFLNFLNS